jgi:hypothetical protein
MSQDNITASHEKIIFLIIDKPDDFLYLDLVILTDTKSVIMKKIIYFAGIVLLSLLALVLITSAFIRKEYSVERGVVINRPLYAVYDYVKYLKNQIEYSVWAKIDPYMNTEFRGTDGTVGFVWSWDSSDSEAGKGEQEITGVEEGKRIDYEIRFSEPVKSTDKAYISLDRVNDSITNVRWAINGRLKYPVNISFLFIDMDEMLGNDLESGLKNLKAILEK